jgi:hypothetical protein
MYVWEPSFSNVMFISNSMITLEDIVTDGTLFRITPRMMVSIKVSANEVWGCDILCTFEQLINIVAYTRC